MCMTEALLDLVIEGEAVRHLEIVADSCRVRCQVGDNYRPDAVVRFVPFSRAFNQFSHSVLADDTDIRFMDVIISAQSVTGLFRVVHYLHKGTDAFALLFAPVIRIAVVVVAMLLFHFGNERDACRCQSHTKFFRESGHCAVCIWFAGFVEELVQWVYAIFRAVVVPR